MSATDYAVLIAQARAMSADTIGGALADAIEHLTQPAGVHVLPFYVVFDGPPDHEAPRFIEVEDEFGVSIKAGEWEPYLSQSWRLGPFHSAETVAKLAQQRDDLLAACRLAVVALAHAAERHSQYRPDYKALSDAIESMEQKP